MNSLFLKAMCINNFHYCQHVPDHHDQIGIQGEITLFGKFTNEPAIITIFCTHVSILFVEIMMAKMFKGRRWERYQISQILETHFLYLFSQQPVIHTTKTTCPLAQLCPQNLPPWCQDMVSSSLKILQGKDHVDP